MTAFLAKNSAMAGFAGNFFRKRKHDTFSQNIASFFLCRIRFCCKLAYIGMTGFLLKKLRKYDGFLCQLGRFYERDFLIVGTCQVFFRRGIISDYCSKNLPTQFIKKACFEENKILKFHLYEWICLEISHNQCKKVKIEIL